VRPTLWVRQGEKVGYNALMVQNVRKERLMETQSVTLTEFKQNLSELVNRAAYGNLRIELVSRGKVKAALISLEDLRRLEALEQAQNQRELYVQQQRAVLNEARVLRERMEEAGIEADSATILSELREERSDELLGLR
jgi:prevent-host-death family protein